MSDYAGGLHELFARSSSSSSQGSNSASGLVTTLVINGLIFLVMMLLFVIHRRSNRHTYMPRTYIGSLRPWQRSPDSPTGLFNWITAMYKVPDTYVLQHHSMDAYLLLRFLKLATIILVVGCCITWPILFPVNATGGGKMQQLNILTFSNVAKDQYARYYAPCFLAWIYVGFIFFTITREHIFYINLRQAYFFSPAYANRISSRTVLFTAVTEDYLNKDKLRALFGREKVKNVWLVTDTSELEKKVNERDDAAMKLEAAETKLIVLANKARNKAIKKQGSAGDSQSNGAGECDNESGSVAARWIKSKDRPTHRLKMLIGKKVDTINWARSEIERLTPEVQELQAKHCAGDVTLVSAVFVEFYRQADAQQVYQSVAHNLPLHMSPRYIGLDPTQVIWSNLRIKWWERIIRYTSTIAVITALIIFWGIPTAVVGAISNINFLTQKVHFLRFINSVPPFILGVITGFLPAVLLSILMALVPIILRLMAKLAGAPSLVAIELSIQNSYFAFQVVEVFLVVTFTSGATSVVVSIINDPTSAPSLLASHLPNASNFYVSYIILQGLSFSSGALLQIVGLILSKILGKLLDKTPRKMYIRWSSLAGLGWGTIYPIFTMLLVIGITYSCIAPLVMGFGSIGLYLFYFAYRYNVLYVYNATIDTQGKSYTRALQHITVGCYLLMGCLIGLFAIATGSNRVAIGPLVLMIIFFIFIVLYHASLNNAMEPLIQYLPKNMEHEEEELLTFKSANVSNGADGPSQTEATAGPSGSAAVKHGGDADDVDAAEKGLTHTSPPPSHPKPNFFTKWLRPDIYCDYATMRRLVPNPLDVPPYSDEDERDAYLHPAVTSQSPLLWIPSDPACVSKQEIVHTMRVIPITDEDAWLDEKGKIVWNEEKGDPPIYKEKVEY